MTLVFNSFPEKVLGENCSEKYSELCLEGSGSAGIFLRALPADEPLFPECHEKTIQEKISGKYPQRAREQILFLDTCAHPFWFFPESLMRQLYRKKFRKW
jgi:hypothetical protein